MEEVKLPPVSRSVTCTCTCAVPQNLTWLKNSTIATITTRNVPNWKEKTTLLEPSGGGSNSFTAREQLVFAL